MATKPCYRREAALKALARVLSHPAFADGLPVRFRSDPTLVVPAIRCNRFSLSVWLPPDLSPFIPLLARFVRSLRRKPLVTIVVRTKPNLTPNNGTPKAPTNGTRPVAIAKTNRTRPKTKVKPKPAWQREWDAMWDRVAIALFGNGETRDGK
jgi:hypothetical protein